LRAQLLDSKASRKVAYLFLLLSWGKVEHRLYPFNDHSISHTTAFTDGLETITSTCALQLVQQNVGQARSGSTQRMSDSNGPTIDIDPLHVCSGLTLPGQWNASKCFINLNQVYLVQRQSSLLEHLVRRWNRCS